MSCFSGEGSLNLSLFYSRQDKENKLIAWKAKNLSWRGRAIRVSSVLISIPGYTVSLFEVPGTISNKTGQLARKFWWRCSQDNSHYFSPTSRHTLYRPKQHGGIGFIRVRDNNICALSKSVWNILAKPHGL